MSHAKEQGRNSYQFFSESMNAVVFKRLMLENKLRKAIERDELELQFQPRVDLRSGRGTGFEALARWRDPDLGMVSPSEFIPLAEETGLIAAIGEWVISAAVQQIVAWEESGLRGLHLSVNLSGLQLRDDSFARQVAEQIGRHGIDPRQLELEITETALMTEERLVIDALEELRSVGVSISLDDFGTGYSSLSYLRRLPLDTLKIDRSFIRSVDEEPDDAHLLGAIISMARVLRLRVVVEGVETAEQLDLLRELGCDEIQGHLMSPPVCAGDVARILREIEETGRAKRRKGRNAD
jgi:EAL domain-containing protein (putative c-di-GMP-specific phosphodiesterase class I)